MIDIMVGLLVLVMVGAAVGYIRKEKGRSLYWLSQCGHLWKKPLWLS